MKKVLITIDTEVGELGRSLPTAFDIFIDGNVQGEEWGYRKIIELLDRYNARGEFFVDVYPVKQFGEERFAELCQSITAAGHNVQLHTHPAAEFDSTRRHLADYSRTEQEEIITTGAARIKKWTGKKATAHRAGGYGANADSIKALEKAGILYDSSYQFESDTCQLPFVHKNAPYKIGAVWEIPVTGYQQNTRYTIAGLPVLRRHRFQKLDIRYGSNWQEIVAAIDQAPEDSVQIIFLHSFNFLNLRYNLKTERYHPISPLPAMVNEFDQLLQWINTSSTCQFSSFDDLTLTELMEDYLPELPSAQPLSKHISEIISEKFLHTIKT